jgi:hypothetical protein
MLSTLKRYKNAGTKTMELLFSAIAFISGLQGALSFSQMRESVGLRLAA